MTELAVFMLIFAAALFLYGFGLFRSRDYSRIPKGEFAKVKDRKQYAQQLGKIIMWVALVPAFVALSAFLRDLGVATRPIWITAVGDLILFIYVGIRVFMPSENIREGEAENAEED